MNTVCKGKTKKGVDCTYKPKYGDYCGYHCTQSISVTPVTTTQSNKTQSTSATHTCFMCQEEYTRSVSLKCDHSFHIKCIGEWYAEKDKCPLCQDILVFKDDHTTVNEALYHTVVKQRVIKNNDERELKMKIEELEGKVYALELERNELNSHINGIHDFANMYG